MKIFPESCHNNLHFWRYYDDMICGVNDESVSIEYSRECVYCGITEILGTTIPARISKVLVINNKKERPK